jgi:hypothetical protein
MLKKISEYIFLKRALQYKKTELRAKSFVSYDKAKTILLLFESNYSEKNPETRRIIESLQADGKRVIAVGFVEKKQIISPTYPEFRILHPKDLELFQRPNSSLIRFIQETEFDLLIDISNKEILPLSYLVLYANARCKTGLNKKQVALYDFAVDIDEMLIEKEMNVDDLEFSFLYNQIIFYLKSIQTND